MIISSIFSTSANAIYQYIYTGNTLTNTYTGYSGGPPPDYTIIENFNNYISVSFLTETLLKDAINLSTSIPFSISLNGGDFFGNGALFYPYPYGLPPGTNLGGVSVDSPNYDIGFVISDFNEKGLPTDWNISIDYNFFAPTGRFWQSYIKTSTNQDITYGGYLGFYDYFGQLDNNPRKWTITVVPEPDSYALMFIGLCIIGVLIRSQKKQVTT